MANGKSRKGRKSLVIAGVLLLLGGAAAWYFFFRKGEEIVTIQTEKILRRNLTELVVANGRLHPVVQVKISPEVSGEIIELPVKEGQSVEKGDLLLRIKPDFYQASRRSAEASYQAAVANKNLAAANLRKAEIEEGRNKALLEAQLISESAYLEVKTSSDVARAQFQSSEHQVDVANAALSRADEELAKTIIASPITGTVSKLNSQLGERVVGTAMMTGTEVMVIADLDEMEARVDIGEVDVVLIAAGQIVRLEVEAFRDRKFKGVVTEIANSSRGLNQDSRSGGGGGGGQQQEATRFEVKIRITDKELFRPGMSVTAEIETRSRTNVLSVPIQSVTTRMPKNSAGKTNGVTSAVTNGTAGSGSKTNSPNPNKAARKGTEPPKPIEVVFVAEGDTVHMVPVKRGISDDNYSEIIEGVEEGQEVVSGSYKAISRDLEDGKKIKRGEVENEPKK
jgi:HlyD family secretion protein